MCLYKVVNYTSLLKGFSFYTLLMKTLNILLNQQLNITWGCMKKFIVALIVFYFGWVNSLVAAENVESGYNCNLNTQVSVAQCDTLVDFYYATNGHAWLNSNTHLWLKNSEPCSWEGVTCWGSRIVRLELPSNGLTGELPALGGLIHLQQLGLFNNPELSGPLPDLTVLPDLTHVIVFKTAMTGFLPDVASIPNLVSLDVHLSAFFGPVPDVSSLNSFVSHGNPLCLSSHIDYSSQGHTIPAFPACEPMLESRLQGELLVTDFGVRPDDGQNDHHLINHALRMLTLTLPSQVPISDLTIRFPAGVYDVEKSISLINFDSVKIVGETADTPMTTFQKGPNFGNSDNLLINQFQHGAIFDLRFGRGLTIKYLKLMGQLTSTTQPHLWWDHGIYVGSSHNTMLSKNAFYHFGDSALTIATDNDDPSLGINSANHLVYDNYFYNITQTSTTSDHGGSSNYSFIENTLVNLKGAVKFSTRMEGAGYVNVLKNHIVSAGVSSGITTNNGIEVEGYEEVNISGNTLSDGEGVGIVVRSVHSENADRVYDWGSVTVEDNQITRYRLGVYISNLPLTGSGEVAEADSFNVSNNQISYMWNGDTEAAIHFVGSQFKRCQANNNTVTGGNYTIWPNPAQTSWLEAQGNVLN